MYDVTKAGEMQLNVKWQKKKNARERDELEKKYLALVNSNILKMTNVTGMHFAGLK